MAAKDARSARRSRTLKSGKIVSMDYSSVASCSVRSISPKGARILYTGRAPLPEAFQLLIQSDGSIRDARVVWREGDVFGVEFTSEARRAPPRKW
ncbi:MAG: PilZ domain-containing protein [Hyphomicrobiales bacterium]